MISPTGRVVKNCSPSLPDSIRALWTISVGGVPIIVIIPEILQAKAIGISNRRASTPDCEAIVTTMGISIATVPVLLTKSPSRIVTRMTR